MSSITIQDKNNCTAKKNSHTYKQKGQLTLFFGASLTIIISILAFLVNIGLFVRAKINLQNAVDAAAWSGAAVQARQLTNIAYMNWELRNVYKKWLFKYYVLGTTSLITTNLNSFGSYPGEGSTMDYRARVITQGTTDEDKQLEDKFNFPSVCIDYTVDSTICTIFQVPGLPDFPPVATVGLAETNKEVFDTITAAKSSNCTQRAQENYKVTMNWTYGIGMDRTPVIKTSNIGTKELGAFPSAIELATRIRNLEYIVNAPPKTRPLCFQGDQNCLEINNLPDPTLRDERVLKAFWAGYRNLENSPGGSLDLKRSFRLTELSPKAFTPNDKSPSGIFIPNTGDKLQKYYLDLQVMTVNYAVFFTMFSPVSLSTFNLSNTGTSSKGECSAVKVAIPVPSYPLGFMKNPEVLTYYAVEGKATYRGLFNPFMRPIQMKAYAAAKPFGGRIGPHLFSVDSGTGTFLIPRTNSGSQKSAPYISGMTMDGVSDSDLRSPAAIQGLSPQDFKKTLGLPLPYPFDNFWVSGEGINQIGGFSTSATDIKFGIPNLVYDLGQGNIGIDKNINQIRYTNVQRGRGVIGSYVTSNPDNWGLFSIGQFKMFKKILGVSGATGVRTSDVRRSLIEVNKPTMYEALNYLIPNRKYAGVSNITHSVVSSAIGPTDSGSIEYYIFAPLYGPGTLFSNISEIFVNQGPIDTFKQMASATLNVYLNQLHMIANKTYSADQRYRDAATYIHDRASSASPTAPQSCLSIAGIFYSYFNARRGGLDCQFNIDMIEGLWNEIYAPGSTGNLFHVGKYVSPIIPTQSATSSTLVDQPAYLMTAFAHGTPVDVPSNAHPFKDSLGITNDIQPRNYYSTKFTPLKDYTYDLDDYKKFPIYSDGSTGTISDIKNMNRILNPLLVRSDTDLIQFLKNEPQ